MSAPITQPDQAGGGERERAEDEQVDQVVHGLATQARRPGIKAASGFGPPPSSSHQDAGRRRGPGVTRQRTVAGGAGGARVVGRARCVRPGASMKHLGLSVPFVLLAACGGGSKPTTTPTEGGDPVAAGDQPGSGAGSAQVTPPADPPPPPPPPPPQPTMNAKELGFDTVPVTLSPDRARARARARARVRKPATERAAGSAAAPPPLAGDPTPCRGSRPPRRRAAPARPRRAAGAARSCGRRPGDR
jgi:hypothetical protein